MKLIDWVQLIIAIPALFGFLFVVGRFIVKFAKAIDLILHEVTPNGGKTTLKDRVIHLERTDQEKIDKLDGLILRMDRQDEVLERQDQVLDQISTMQNLKGEIWERIEKKLDAGKVQEGERDKRDDRDERNYKERLRS